MSCPSCTSKPILPKTVDAATVLAYGLTHDNRGRVRWLGLWWYGVPMPLRFHAAWKTARQRRIEGKPAKLTRATLRKWKGCGCIVIMKDAWAKLTG